MGRLKEGKAAGEYRITNEVWKFGGEEIREWVWEFCNRIWRGEGWTERWMKEIVGPTVKKGEEIVKEYRGFTLMSTLYKIYTSALAERTREEAEEKDMIPHDKTGFREGMGTIDNIYVLNYVMNR